MSATRAADKTPGKYGGTLRIIGGSAKDTRMMVIYGYARLVGYTPDYDIVPDIAESFDVEDGRIFTFHLRPGHKWSDGEPFTAEDFRFYWEDMADDPNVSRFGPPKELLVDGEKPKVEILDPLTVRYSWSKPNSYFLPALAAAQPVEIFRPAHYLKQFHAKYIGEDKAEAMAEEAGERNWVALLYSKDRSYRNDNLDYPTLQPWVLKTQPPSDRYVFERNPYFHRVDENGLQLPYIDEVALTISSSDLIPAKVAAGETDLQGAYLAFSNFTFLKEAEERSDYEVRRWLATKGARVALYPDLNNTDPVYRDLFRKADFRRALSVAIDRDEINNTIFYGVASAVQQHGAAGIAALRGRVSDEVGRVRSGPCQPAARRARADRARRERHPAAARWPAAADRRGDRRRGDRADRRAGACRATTGRRSASRSSSSRRSARSSTTASIPARRRWRSGGGWRTRLITPDMAPAEFAPFSPDQFQWPAWGLWAQTSGQMGEAPDMETRSSS